MNWAGKASLDWTPENLAAQDCIVIATHHAAFDLQQLAATADLIIDTRNAMNGVKTKPGQVVKA
jgi:UDP-N-acetyl-D-glucosamine dehydrogenase